MIFCASFTGHLHSLLWECLFFHDQWQHTQHHPQLCICVNCNNPVMARRGATMIGCRPSSSSSSLALNHHSRPASATPSASWARPSCCPRPLRPPPCFPPMTCPTLALGGGTHSRSAAVQRGYNERLQAIQRQQSLALNQLQQASLSGAESFLGAADLLSQAAAAASMPSPERPAPACVWQCAQL